MEFLYIYLLDDSSYVTEPPEAPPHQILNGPYFLWKKVGKRAGGGGGFNEKIFWTIFLKNKVLKNFRWMTIHVYQKRGPNFTNSILVPRLLLGNEVAPIPALGGHPLQICWPSITEARANFPNVLANILWPFLPGVPRRGYVLDTQTPSSYATGR